MHAPSRHTPRFRRLVAALALGGLVLAACGNAGDDDAGPTTTTTASDDGGADEGAADDGGSDEFVSISGVPGVSDEAIEFTVIGTGAGSSPIGGCQLDCYVAGIEAYFEFRNSQGGVHGRELRIAEVVDDELLNNQVKSLEVVQAGDAFGVFALPVLPSGFPDLAASGMPVYAVTANAPEAAGLDNVFAITGASCLSCARPFYAYTATLAEATKTGHLAYGVAQGSVDCAAGQKASIERWGGDLGVEVGYHNDTLAYGLPNGIAPEVSAMKSAGVDLIFICMDANAAGTLEQELERQGMGDVPVMMTQVLGDPDFIERGGDLVEGSLTFSVFPLIADDAAAPGLVDYREWIAKSDISPMNEAYSIQGWVNAAMAYEGLVAAGPDFDQAKVVAATNTITDFTAGGLVSPIDWTRQHEPWTEDDLVSHGPDPVCVTYAQVSGGEWQLIGDDPAEPWFCWDPAELEGGFTEPVQTSFE